MSRQLSTARDCVSSQQAQPISVTPTVQDSGLQLQQLLRATAQPDSTQVPLVVVTQYYLARSGQDYITRMAQDHLVDWRPVEHEGSLGVAALQQGGAQEEEAASQALQQLVQQLKAQAGGWQGQKWPKTTLEQVWVRMLAGVVRWVVDTATSCGRSVAVAPDSKLMQILVPTGQQEQLQCESSITEKFKGVKVG